MSWLAMAGGAAIGLGVFLGYFAWTTPPDGPRQRAAHPRRTAGRLSRVWAGLDQGSRRRLYVGLPAGLVLWLVSGWFLTVVLVPAALVGIPLLLAPPRSGTPIARLEAMEEWTRSLAGVLTVGIGLEQAIITTARSAPEQIRAEVTALAARLNSRVPTASALRQFADDLDDATGDLIAMALTLGARRRGMGLSQMLESLAGSVARDVAIRRSVDAERAKLATTSRMITLITLLVMGGLFLLSDYVAPYRTPLGAMVLVGLLACYVGTLLWMRAIGTSPKPARLLTPAVHP